MVNYLTDFARCCLSSSISSLLLGWLLVLPETAGQKCLQAFVLDGLVTLELSHVELEVASQDRSAAGLHRHGRVEVGNELSCLLC